MCVGMSVTKCKKPTNLFHIIKFVILVMAYVYTFVC